MTTTFHLEHFYASDHHAWYSWNHSIRTVCLAYHEHMMFPNYQWVFVERIDADFHNISFSFGDDDFTCSDSDISSAINGSINLLYGSVGGDNSVSVMETDIGITIEEYQQH